MVDALWKSTPSSSEAAVGVTVVAVVEVEVGEVVCAAVTSDAFWILPSGPMIGAGELPCDHRETLLRCASWPEEDWDAKAGKARSPLDVRDLAC